MRICFVGDSLVNGTGDPMCLGWAGRACAAAREAGVDVTYYNLGVRGDTSRMIRARIGREAPPRLLPAAEGRVVLAFGVADALMENGKARVRPEESVDNLWRIVSETARKWPVIMAGPPPVADAAQNARVGELSGLFAKVCRDMGIPFLDMFGPLSGNGDYQRDIAATDGVHPGAVGYDCMAELFIGWQAWIDWF